MKNKIKIVVLIFCINTIILDAQTNIKNQTEQKNNQKAENTTLSKNYKYEIIINKDKTFGYKIIADGKPMINQESMPAVPGNKGFPRKIDAERMANLVIFKLKNNIMPPTVSVAEVDSIKGIK